MNWIEPGEAVEDRVADGLGDTKVVEGGPAELRARLQAGRGLGQHLLEEEGVALGPLVEEIDQLRLDLVGPRHRRDHLRDTRVGEGLELDDLSEAAAAPGSHGGQQRVPAMELVAAVGDERERAHALEALRDVVEQLARGVVRPVDVLDHEQQRVIRGRNREQRDDPLEQPQLRVARVRDRRGSGTVAELGEELRELTARGPEPGDHLVRVRLGEVIADRLDEREIGEGELGLAAPAAEHLGSEPPRLPAELVRQPGLADARFAREHDHAAVAAARLEQGVLELRELVIAADQVRAEAGQRHDSDFRSPASRR